MLIEATTPWTPPPPGGPLAVAGLKADVLTVGETGEGKVELGGAYGCAPRSSELAPSAAK